MDAADGYAGFASPNDQAGGVNAQALLIERMLAQTHTAMLVRVAAVSSADDGGGRVDVQPLVHQVDGAGQIVPHGTVHGLPYIRLQGGTSAFIVNPVTGDIGLAVFASRDISTVKATGQASPPGSGRRNSMSDGIYLGGLLNGTPTQTVKMDTDGITLTSPTAVTINAPKLIINADTVTHDGVNVGSTHRHSGVRAGLDPTGMPE